MRERKQGLFGWVTERGPRAVKVGEFFKRNCISFLLLLVADFVLL